MAWRFRRSLNFGPVKLNLSRSGVGYSIGGRGFRVGRDAKGRSYTAASIPGTGLYNRTYASKDRTPAEHAAPAPAAPSPRSSGVGLVIGMLLIAFIAGGIFVQILTSVFSSHPAAPPAAITAPATPPPLVPATQHARGSARPSTAKIRHRSAKKKAIRTPQSTLHKASDAPPPVDPAR